MTTDAKNALWAGVKRQAHVLAPVSDVVLANAKQDQEIFTRVAALPSDGRAARAARSVVRAMCAQWRVDAMAETAVGCVSELATNAVRHVEWGKVPFGERVVWLLVGLWGRLLVVEVRDPSSVLPIVNAQIDFSEFVDAPRDVLLLPESGLGLRIVVEQVEQLKGIFGAVKLPGGGKTVFFALPCEAQQ